MNQKKTSDVHARVARALVILAALAPSGCARTEVAKSAQEQGAVLEREQSAEKLLARGYALLRVGDLTRAEQYLSLALDAGADRNVALPLLVRTCIGARRYRVAIDYAEPYLREAPDDHALRFLVASLYLAVGDTQTARAELEKAIESSPDHADVHYTLAVLLRDEAGERINADAHFREYLRISPSGSHAKEARAALLKVVREAGP